jgi:hypothetical protein
LSTARGRSGRSADTHGDTASGIGGRLAGGPGERGGHRLVDAAVEQGLDRERGEVAARGHPGGVGERGRGERRAGVGRRELERAPRVPDLVERRGVGVRDEIGRRAEREQAQGQVRERRDRRVLLARRVEPGRRQAIAERPRQRLHLGPERLRGPPAGGGAASDAIHGCGTRVLAADTDDTDVGEARLAVDPRRAALHRRDPPIRHHVAAALVLGHRVGPERAVEPHGGGAGRVLGGRHGRPARRLREAAVREAEPRLRRGLVGAADAERRAARVAAVLVHREPLGLERLAVRGGRPGVELEPAVRPLLAGLLGEVQRHLVVRREAVTARAAPPELLLAHAAHRLLDRVARAGHEVEPGPDRRPRGRRGGRLRRALGPAGGDAHRDQQLVAEALEPHPASVASWPRRCNRGARAW